MCVTAQSINQLRGKTYRVTQISIVGAEDFYARTIQRPKELKVDSSVQEEELFNTSLSKHIEEDYKSMEKCFYSIQKY